MEATIVGIRPDQEGGLVGAGLLIASDTILTCAHVVCRALGLSDEHESLPGGRVWVEFPLAAGEGARAAEVVFWRPRRRDGAGDIAGLRLDAAVSPGTQIAHLVTTTDLWRHPFRVYGYPVAHDHGVWAHGALLARQAAGLVQMEDERSHGFAVQEGFSGAPVWDDELNAVVGITVAAEADPTRRTAYLIPGDVLLEAWSELADITSAPSPYRGLDPFREEDQARFFGRREAAEEIAEKVVSRPVTTVVGPSGVGKSSLVFAGVIPRVRRAGLTVLAVRPRGDFAAELADGLGKALDSRDLFDPRTALSSGRLPELIGQALDRAGSDEMLIVVDQFEEVFAQEAAAVDLMAEVLKACQDPRSRMRMVLTLRGDYLDRALRHADLAESIKDPVTVGAMTPDQLREAITEPLPAWVAFEDELVDRIVEDVGSEPGWLPSLQFALDQLWRTQRHGLLTHAAYTGLRGVAGALAQHADSEWRKLSGPERNVGRSLLMRLVRVEPDHPPTRVTVPRATLSDEEAALAERLAATRLVVTGRDSVELAHEALITHWQRLRAWVEDNEAFLTWLSATQTDAASWIEADRDAEHLLSGGALTQAERQLGERSADISSVLREFIKTSAAAARRATLRRRLVRAAVAGVLAIALAAGALVAVAQQRAADERRREARQQAVAAARNLSGSISPYGQNPTTSTDLLKTIAAYRTADLPQTRQLLFDQYVQTRNLERVLPLPGQGAPPDDSRPDLRAHRPSLLAMSADGQLIAAAIGKSGVRVWTPDSAPGQSSWDLPLRNIIDVAMTPRTRQLAAVGAVGNDWLWLFDLRRRAGAARRIRLSTDSEPSVRQIALSPDGRAVATTDQHGDRLHVEVRDTRDGRIIRSLKIPGAPTYDDDFRLWFDADGQALITADTFTHPYSSSIRRWDLRSGEFRTVPTGANTHAAVSSDGSTLVTCQERQEGGDVVTVRRTDRTEPQKRLTLAGAEGVEDLPDGKESVDCLAEPILDPTGRYLLTSSVADSGTIVYDLQEQVPVAHFGAKVTFVENAVVAAMPDGLRIASYPFRESQLSPLPLWLHRVRFGSLQNSRAAHSTQDISADGRMLLTMEHDHRAVDIWDRYQQRRLGGVRLPIANDRACCANFHPDGRSIVVSYDNEPFLDVFNVPATRRLYRIHPPRAKRNTPITYSVDRSGRLVISTAGLVTTWDPSSGKQVGPPLDISATRSPGFILIDKGATLLTIRDDMQGLDVWDFRQRRKVGTIALPKSDIVTIRMTADQRRLLLLTKEKARPEGIVNRLSLWSLNGQRASRISELLSFSTRVAGPADIQQPIGTILHMVVKNDVLTFDLKDERIRSHLRTHNLFSARISKDAKVAFLRVDSWTGLVAIDDPETWARGLCQLVDNRGFTPDERKQLPAGMKTTGLCS